MLAPQTTNTMIAMPWDDDGGSPDAENHSPALSMPQRRPQRRS
jgi:hypothetical protein